MTFFLDLALQRELDTFCVWPAHSVSYYFPKTLQMSCPEMGYAFQAMSADMQRKLNSYTMNLQRLDPRMAAQQQEQAAREREMASYTKSNKNSKLLADAYKKQAKKNREGHDKRIAKITGKESVKLPE